MSFLVFGFVVLLHTANKITEVTKWLFVTISDKVSAIWRIGENMKSDYSKTPPALSLSDRHPPHHHLLLLLKEYIMCGLLSPRDLWQGTLTWESYYRGRQNVGAYKKDQITKRQNMIKNNPDITKKQLNPNSNRYLCQSLSSHTSKKVKSFRRLIFSLKKLRRKGHRVR